MWPLKGMHQLMRRTKEYKRLEDDRLQGKGKAPAPLQYRKDYHPEKFQQRTRRESRALGKGSARHADEVNVTFKKPIYKILEHIKNEPYF